MTNSLTSFNGKDGDERGKKVDNVQSQGTIDTAAAAEEVFQNYNARSTKRV
jgi:hypothetical protein